MDLNKIRNFIQKYNLAISTKNFTELDWNKLFAKNENELIPFLFTTPWEYCSFPGEEGYFKTYWPIESLAPEDTSLLKDVKINIFKNDYLYRLDDDGALNADFSTIDKSALINSIHVQNEFEELKNIIIQETLLQREKTIALDVCKRQKLKSKSCCSSTDAALTNTMEELSHAIGLSNNKEEIINALISAAKDLRTPENGKMKFGWGLFCLRFGDYQGSPTYRSIIASLNELHYVGNLEEASRPRP